MKSKKITEVQRHLAEYLVKTEALRFGDFTLRSGRKSPYYLQVEMLMADPIVWKQVTWFMVEESKEIAGSRPFHFIAGGELRGAFFARSLADAIEIPFICIRKEKKGYGAQDLIVGQKPTALKNLKVLLVEDLITDGGSKLHFINAITGVGGIVNDCLVVVDREQGGTDNLSDLKVNLSRLITTNIILQVVEEGKLVSDKQIANIKSYVANPDSYQPS